MDRVGNQYILCVLGYLNGWIGDRVRADITGAYGVPGENKNVRRVVEFCMYMRVYTYIYICIYVCVRKESRIKNCIRDI